MSFNNPLVGGENGELIRAAISSPDYVAGVSGWIIRRDGSAEFNDVTIRFDLATGSIVVGPSTGPQVVIRTVNDGWEQGIIEFPTNDAAEERPAFIRVTELGGLPTSRTSLQIFASEVDNTGEVAAILLTSNRADGSDESTVTIRSQFNSSSMTMTEAGLEVSGDAFVSDEILVNTNDADANYPARVTHGRINTSVTNTTIGATDTAIGNAAVANTYLQNGRAYKVDVQMRTRSSSGSSPVGTQVVDWKLWDGAVGGTLLGTTTRKATSTVGTNQGVINFGFVFRYTGTTGTKTLTLSGAQVAGTDTIQAVVTTDYYMIANYIGDPAQIINL